MNYFSVDKIEYAPPPTKITNHNKTTNNAEIRNKSYVNVVSCVTPSEMYITYLSHEKRLSKLKEKMNAHYEESVCELDTDWKAGDICAAYSSNVNGWHRAIIEANDNETGITTVFFKDIAVSEQVVIENIRKLADKFLSVRDGARKCHLSNIVPAIGNTWPNITCKYLKEIVEGNDRFYIDQDGLFENGSMPIKLWTFHTEIANTLLPNVQEWIEVNEMIIRRGLAIRGPIGIEEPIQSMEDLQLSANSEKMEEESIKTATISKWLPPVMPNRRTFNGIPAFVDDNLDIYIFLPDFHKHLASINDMLEKKYKDSSPGPDDMFWYEGQPCVAQYWRDSNYYRGIVTKIKEDNVLTVQFVDYGNVEDCQVKHLRKDIITDEYSTQVFKCRIPGVMPKQGERWSGEVLDYVHKKIVERLCFISVLGETDDGVACVSLKVVENDLDLIDILLKKNYARITGINNLKTYSGFENETEVVAKMEVESDGEFVVLEY
jgi:hypothetical protein